MDSRPRKTTLENFNEELAILDRPLEGDVEYYDERPRRQQRWRGTSTVIIGFVLFTGAGALFFSHSDPETIIAAAQAAAATAPPPQSPAPAAPDVPAVTAPEAPAAQPAEVAMEPAAEAPKWRQPPPRKEWAKLRLRSPSPTER